MAFVIDAASNLPVVLAEASSEHGFIRYTYGLSLISEARHDRRRLFHHYDGLSSLVGLTDAVAAEIKRFSYDPWGNLTRRSDELETRSRFMFASEDPDESTQLYYLRARWYDPSVGRFLTPDPVQLSALDVRSLNRYPYSRNNPVSWVDHSGLSGTLTVFSYVNSQDPNSGYYGIFGGTLGFHTRVTEGRPRPGELMETGRLRAFTSMIHGKPR